MIARVAFTLLFAATSLSAQVIPNAQWQTLTTRNFRVHFTPELEAQARRAAANAERAWERLSADLVAPRGPVDLVIADNVDFTNGYATMFPSNRIVIYAHPPVHEGSLRFYNDWTELVITHELAHIFQLDRTLGWWRVAQNIFGRDAIWFPNIYLPNWLVEGFAVYEETRHTGAGRLAGSGHRMVARASALGGHVPRLDELSASTSRFPGGGVTYVYGSLLLDYLAKTRGDSGIRRFVERTSAAPIPWLLNRQAKRSFGITLENAWREWSDSVSRDRSGATIPLEGWRDLTPRGRYVFHPRWTSDSTLIYVGSTGKDVASAYSVDLSGRARRIGRRSAFDPNVPLADGGILYSELEYVTPYVVRSDLRVQNGRRSRRLTRSARLSHADVREDGKIVAVQALPASTRVVIVERDGSRITPITEGTGDVQWAEPRWSPDGRRVAAVRLNRGAIADVVLMDTAGAGRTVLTERAVITGLSWRSNDEIAFTSDRSGSMQVYVARITGDSALDTRQATEVATGIFSPEFRDSGDLLAAVHYRSDGYRLGVGNLASSLGERAADSARARDSLPPAPSVTMAATKYSPWRSLVPTYWRLAGEGSADEAIFGATTSNTDIVGRHSYVAQAQTNFDTDEKGGYLLYRYSGLGAPLLDVSLSQNHERVAPIVDINGDTAGSLRERSRYASFAATLLRPRMRTFAYASLGVSVEAFDFSTDPDEVISRLNPVFRDVTTLYTLQPSAGWSNTQRPELSISRENGIAVDAYARVRQYRGDDQRSHEVVGIGRGYRAFDLGAWAHHVIAVRAAGGIRDPQSVSGFSVGGISGGSLEVIPGFFDVGNDNEVFGVRGFAPGTLYGLRAAAASVELRGPLFAPSRGYRILPFFLDRSAFALFAEGGSAWCPSVSHFLCDGAPFDHRAIISAGGELRLYTAIQYDVPIQFRLGVASPVYRPELAKRDATFYLTVGGEF